MTLANAKVLYAHLMEIGRTLDAKNLEKRYPELAEPEPEPDPEPDPEHPLQKKSKSTPSKPQPDKQPEKKGLLTRAKNALKK